MPEYFLVPLQSMPRSIDDITQVGEGFGADPVLARGYGADFNETAYPFYPGPRAPLRAGQTTSWFYGESLQPDAVTLVFAHAAKAGAVVRFGALTGDGSTRWGAPVPVPAGATTVTGRHPTGLCDRALGPVVGGRTPFPAGGHHGGRTPLRARGCVVVCARSGTVAAGRPFAGLRGVHAAQATGAHRRLDGRRPAAPRTGPFEHDQVRADPARRARADRRGPLGRLGLGVVGDRLGQRREGPERPRQRLRPRPTGPHPGRRRCRDLPLPAKAPALGQHPQLSARSRSSWRCSPPGWCAGAAPARRRTMRQSCPR